jgi:hypothetical protein
VRAAPCIEGTCGSQTPTAVTSSGLDPFTTQPAAEWTLQERRAARPARGVTSGLRAPVPEPPPPRPA